MGQSNLLRRWLLPLVLFFILPGCYKASFYRDPSVVRGREHDEWSDFFVFGTVGKQDYDVSQFCPAEVAEVRTGGNFATGLVSVVTIGIYTPRKVYVTCADDKSARASGGE
jgi:hypothetical protein